MGIQCLRWGIQTILQDALYSFIREKTSSADLPENVPLGWFSDLGFNPNGAIALSRRFQSDAALTVVGYVTPIALQLQHRLERPVNWIAAQVVEYWSRSRLLSQRTVATDGSQQMNWVFEHIVPQQLPSGLIQLRLSVRGIAAWLEYWRCISPVQLSRECDRAEVSTACKVDSASLFSMQHSYARTCSLLRRAQQGGQVYFGDLSQEDMAEEAKGRSAAAISWLTPEEQLVFVHESEHQLFCRVLEMAEILVDGTVASMDAIAVWKLSVRLSDAFQSFHRDCLMWGEVQQDNPALVQARLGLTSITRTVLYALLVGQLHAPAPEEL